MVLAVLAPAAHGQTSRTWSGLAWDASDLYATGSLEVVPEPATLALVTLGGLALLRRRRPHGPRVARNS